MIRGILFGVFFLLAQVFPICAEAQVSVTHTISWPSLPAHVEVITLEKQIDGGAFTPLIVLASPLPLRYVDTGNTPGVTTCYRATPSNSLPSTGAASEACSLTIGIVGDMPQITIVPTLVP